MQDKKDNPLKDTTRLEIFCDAVFAIAITLLVLELIQILYPRSDTGILQTCLHHWRSFLAFTIGFITIMVCWVNHHVAFEYIEKTDTRFLWINGFLMFIVTLIPFSTAILAEYLENEGKVTLAIYGVNYILIAIAADAICLYARKQNLVKEEYREFFVSYELTYRYSVYYTIAAFLLCLVSIVIPVLMYAVMFALFASPKVIAGKLHRYRISRSAV
jgi:uncharacterized membrane protein